jgi:hypothetical protein
VTPRCTPLRDTLQALAEDFAHAIVRAAREASLRELVDTRELGRVPERPTPGPRASAAPAPIAPTPARVARLRRSRTASAVRAKPTQLELLPDRAETYPDAAIVDPTAILGGPRPAQDAPGRSIAPEKAPKPPPAREARSAEPPKAALPAMRPGEELLRAAGGGVVLRRRRVQQDAPG